jgi:hypothetical protein
VFPFVLECGGLDNCDVILVCFAGEFDAKTEYDMIHNYKVL